MNTIYLDNNATTQSDQKVVESMLPYFHDLYGNPSSMHTFGGQVGKAIDNARQSLANLLGAHPSEILYTSCGTESDSTAILAAVHSQPEKKHIVTTRVEHPAVLNLCQHLERNGYEVTYLGVDDKGRISMDEYTHALKKDTCVISIMFANNEVGNVYPIQKMAEIAKEMNIPFHTDAVQAVGKLAIDVNKIPVDFLSLSGHKLHAPKGIGALYIRKGTRFRTFLRGGHQEKGRRAGTENVPYIIGLGTAAELAAQNMLSEQAKVANLRDDLENRLLKSIDNCIVNGDVKNRLPNTSNISFKNIEGEAILLMLDRKGICASSGSACTSGSLEPSHVLRAMGVPFTYAHGSIRLSLSQYNTQAEIDYVVKEFPAIIQRLRDISPFKD